MGSSGNQVPHSACGSTVTQGIHIHQQKGRAVRILCGRFTGQAWKKPQDTHNCREAGEINSLGAQEGRTRCW